MYIHNLFEYIQIFCSSNLGLFKFKKMIAYEWRWVGSLVRRGPGLLIGRGPSSLLEMVWLIGRVAWLIGRERAWLIGRDGVAYWWRWLKFKCMLFLHLVHFYITTHPLYKCTYVQYVTVKLKADTF